MAPNRTAEFASWEMEYQDFRMYRSAGRLCVISWGQPWFLSTHCNPMPSCMVSLHAYSSCPELCQPYNLLPTRKHIYLISTLTWSKQHSASFSNISQWPFLENILVASLCYVFPSLFISNPSFLLNPRDAFFKWGLKFASSFHLHSWPTGPGPHA